ncbi:MAG: sulfotransferase family 2 domain-containing protein [Nocardioides sp.]
MIVSRSQRVLFVHVQKTGGMTIDTLLLEMLPGAERVEGLPGGRHVTLQNAAAAHPEVADFWIFGFVRNPWSRMWSWWSMVQRRGEAAASGRNPALTERVARNKFWTGAYAELSDFEAFVMKGPDLFARLGMPQVDYLSTPQRRADKIGRIESFDADLAQVCGRIGVELPSAVPRQNSGSTGDYRDHYTPAMRQRIAELFAPDVREFGYEF